MMPYKTTKYQPVEIEDLNDKIHFHVIECQKMVTYEWKVDYELITKLLNLPEDYFTYEDIEEDLVFTCDLEDCDQWRIFEMLVDSMKLVEEQPIPNHIATISYGKQVANDMVNLFKLFKN